MGANFNDRMHLSPSYGRRAADPKPENDRAWTWKQAAKAILFAAAFGAAAGWMMGEAQSAEKTAMERYEVCWSNFAVDALEQGARTTQAARIADQECTATKAAAARQHGKQQVRDMRSYMEVALNRANPN